MTLDLAALDRIEALRQQATPGPYVVTEDRLVRAPNGSIIVDHSIDNLIAAHPDDNGTNDMAYLATLSPEVVGELLQLARERLEQAERIQRIYEVWAERQALLAATEEAARAILKAAEREGRG